MEMPYKHDLRAASTISRGARARTEKYYSFRHTKASQLHQLHYRFLDSNDQRLALNAGLWAVEWVSWLLLGRNL